MELKEENSKLRLRNKELEIKNEELYSERAGAVYQNQFCQK